MGMNITLYHNPNCGTSRNVLEIIRAHGIEPRVIEYLKTPPTKAELQELVKRAGVSVREWLREKGTPYAELDLGNAKWTETELLDFIVQHPILLNRPIVATSGGVALCRPAERVMEMIA